MNKMLLLIFLLVNTSLYSQSLKGYTLGSKVSGKAIVKTINGNIITEETSVGGIKGNIITFVDSENRIYSVSFISDKDRSTSFDGFKEMVESYYNIKLEENELFWEFVKNRISYRLLYNNQKQIQFLITDYLLYDSEQIRIKEKNSKDF